MFWLKCGLMCAWFHCFSCLICRLVSKSARHQLFCFARVVHSACIAVLCTLIPPLTFCLVLEFSPNLQNCSTQSRVESYRCRYGWHLPRFATNDRFTGSCPSPLRCQWRKLPTLRVASSRPHAASETVRSFLYISNPQPKPYFLPRMPLHPSFNQLSPTCDCSRLSCSASRSFACRYTRLISTWAVNLKL
jgi:hypothetical protein